jgi:hypothetical protein
MLRIQKKSLTYYMEGYDRGRDRPPCAIFLIGMVYYPLTHSQAGGTSSPHHGSPETVLSLFIAFDSNIVRNWFAGRKKLPPGIETTTARRNFIPSGISYAPPRTPLIVRPREDRPPRRCLGLPRNGHTGLVGRSYGRGANGALLAPRRPTPRNSCRSP